MAVYFAHAPAVNLIKIGFASDPVARVSRIDTGSPIDVVLLGSVPGELADEHALHVKFHHIRARTEWFHATRELIEFIHRTCGTRAPTRPLRRDAKCKRCGLVAGHNARTCPEIYKTGSPERIALDAQVAADVAKTAAAE